MDHKTFMAELPNDTLAELSERSDARGLRHLAWHLGLIALCAFGIAVRVPLWGLLLPVQGVLLIFLFTLEHECTHKTPFATPWLNEVAGHVAGALILLPFTWFRYFHLAHHRWTNLPGKDPELESPKPETKAQFFWHVSGLSVWKGLVGQIVQNALGRGMAGYIPERAQPRVRREARILLLLYACLGLSLLLSPLALWLWLVPLLLGQPFLRVYLLAEHGRCPQVADMFDNTRTTFTNRLVRFLAWNMPYHVEHHVAPNVPFHRLPDLHVLIADHLKHTETGYRRFAARWIADT